MVDAKLKKKKKRKNNPHNTNVEEQDVDNGS